MLVSDSGTWMWANFNESNCEKPSHIDHGGNVMEQNRVIRIEKRIKWNTNEGMKMENWRPWRLLNVKI